MLQRFAIVVFVCLASACAVAADARLVLPSFAGLERKSIESVDITIGAFPLHLIGRVLDSSDDPDSVAVRKLVKGIKTIIVRSYKFDADNVYSKADVDSVRSQLSGPGWSQLAKVRDKKDNQDVDVFVAYDHDKVVGLAIVASHPREFSIVNIIGEVDLEQVATLEKQFGLPRTAASRAAERAL